MIFVPRSYRLRGPGSSSHFTAVVTLEPTCQSCRHWKINDSGDGKEFEQLVGVGDHIQISVQHPEVSLPRPSIQKCRCVLRIKAEMARAIVHPERPVFSLALLHASASLIFDPKLLHW
jgi:hypothetical protein